MAKVYVSITSSYARTVWDSAGGTNYTIGDRVEYTEGSYNKIFVCISDNASTTTPDLDSSNWAQAGTEDHPFLTEGQLGSTYHSGYIWAGAGEWYLEQFYEPDYSNYGTVWQKNWQGEGIATINFAHEAADADGSTRHLILGDGSYQYNAPTSGPQLWLKGIIESKNQHGAFLDFKARTGYGTESCTLENAIVGSNSASGWFTRGAQTVLKGCKFVDHRYDGLGPGDKTARATTTNNPTFFRGFNQYSNIQATDCLFEVSKSKLDYILYNAPATSFFKNCTFNIALSSNAYNGSMVVGSAAIDKCIYYIDTFWKNHGSPSSAFWPNQSVKETCVHVANFVDLAGDVDPSPQWSPGPNDLSSVTTENPLFVDPAGNDLRLRPSSPLIGGRTDSLTLLEAQYPNSVWYDSSATSGGDGSKESPFDVFLSAIQASSTHTVLIKNGIHTLGQQIIDTGGSPVTLVGESTDAILFFQGGSGYGYINTSQGGNSDLLTLKNLSFHYNGGSVYGIFNTKDLTASECKFSMTDNALLAGATNRGWFTGVKGGPAETLRLSCCEISGNAINGVSGASLISGGDYNQSCFAYIYICDCTIVSEGSDTNDFYFHFAGPTEFELKNTIHVGFDGTETLGKNPTVGSGNIYSNTNITPVLPKDSSSIDPNFVGSGDYRLRPSSAAIGGIKAEDNSSVWVTNTAGTGGTGTEEDPYYFGSLDQAYTDAGSFGSIVFKNGSYSVSGVFTFNSDTQANNVNYHAETNGGVEFTAEKILFGHSGLSVTQSLNYTGLKLISTNASQDNFLLNQSINNLVAAHVFASCHLQTNHSFLEVNGTSTTPGKVIFRNSRLSKVSATNYGYLFEQRNGNTIPADLSFENCIIENSLSTSNLTKIFRRITATLKSTIIIDYSNSATALAVDPAPVNLAGSNCIIHGDGTDLYPNESNIAVDPLFVDPAGGNFSLRPNSPLIGQG